MFAVSRELLEEQIYRYLCAQLETHQLAVGTHLKASEIATELSVSRTSVRKAIARLVEDGCVQLNEANRPIVVSLPKKCNQPSHPIFAYVNQTEQAYWAIFDAIFAGRLRAGTNVNGQELAQGIGVSLGTIRQSLDWLCRDGLLLRLPRRGWKVIHLNEKDVVDAFQIRILLEHEGIGRAIHVIPPEQLEALIAENRQVVQDGKNMSEDQIRRIDYRFHRTLLVANESPILLQAVDPLIRMCMLTGIPFDVPKAVVETTFLEHIEIAQALLDKNLPRAQEVMKNHLTRSMRKYERLHGDPIPKPPME